MVSFPTLYDDQVPWFDQVKAAIHQYHRVLGQAPTGFGKCLGAGTPILMFDGTIKPVEQVQEGELVMGPDSQARRVVGVTTGWGELYRVTPKKGDSYVVNADHILSLKMTDTNQIVNIEVRDYLKTTKTFKHCAKGYRVGVEFAPSILPLAIPPYVLGAWLGDGNTGSGLIHSIDEELIRVLRFYGEHIDETFVSTEEPGKCPKHLVHGLTSRLRNIGVLGNKHIPLAYKIASKQKRKELLAGLLDTDGSRITTGYEYISKLKRLADDVVFIARSLGYAAYVAPCQKTCSNNGVTGTYYRVHLWGDFSDLPIQIERKKAEPRRQKKDPLKVGIKVESIGAGRYYGFELIGPDKLFLLGDFTVTHNTTLATRIVAGAMRCGTETWVIAHRDELIQQISKRFTRYDIQHDFIAAGYPRGDALIKVVSKDTLRARLGDYSPPPLFIWDEAHHLPAKTNLEICDWAKETAILGLSATPQRLDGKGLDIVFKHMVLGPQIRTLINSGRLVRPIVYAPPTDLDLSKCTKGGKDGWTAKSMKEAVLRSYVVGKAVEHYQQYCPDTQAIVFCCDLEHCDRVVEAFDAAGIPAAKIDGTMNKSQRQALVQAFEDRAIKILVSCELFLEGFDCPDIETIIWERPTQSLVIWKQGNGRGLRADEGKTHCNIIDMVGNCYRPGLWMPDRDDRWSLEGRDKKGEKNEAPKLKQCPRCSFVWEGLSRVCELCGYEIPAKERELLQVDGQLVLLSEEAHAQAMLLREQQVRQRVSQERRAKTLKDWEAIAAERGHDKGWAWRRFKMKTAKFRGAG